MAQGMTTELDALAAESEETRQELLKAHFFSRERQQSRTLANVDEVERAFVGVGAVEPPYNPATLATLLEHSSALRQNIDSYVTNIDAFGHRLEPVIDLEAADADDRLRTYLLERRDHARPDLVADPLQQVPDPTDEELVACKAELREKMRVEKERLGLFFDFACLDISFVTLRRRTRQDIEVQGNGYWEVLRGEDGKVCGFEYVPAFTVRHMPLDAYPINIAMRMKTDDFSYDTIKVRKHFRRYIQMFEQRVVYFKEFGDPRVLGSKSGRYYRDVKEMQEAQGDDTPATEILHFKVHTSKSSYGIPRWIGTLISVLGSRQAEEVNLSYFENKSIPPLAILVSGGRISQETVNRLQDYINNEIKGKRNFHKLLVLEAESATGATTFENAGRMKVDLKPLTSAQTNDALFQNYDERNIDKVGMAFRLPRMLRGDIRDFNRATGEAALEFAEAQVFGPERDEFDFLINRKILPELGIRFWKFKSAAPSTRNVKDLAGMVSDLTHENILTPAEARDLAQQIFNRELRKIDAPWVRQPAAFTLAGIAPPDELAAPGMVTPSVAAHGAGGAPLGGQAMNRADQPGGAVAAGGGADNTLKLTGTDLASIVTVKEARASAGMGPLLTPAGEVDPDNFLTLAEFKAKRAGKGKTLGEAQGTYEAGAGGAAAGLAPGGEAQKDDMGTGDLRAGGGLLASGQPRRRPNGFLQLPPGIGKQEELMEFARTLVAMRKAIADAEGAEALEVFAVGQVAAVDVEP